MFGPRAGPEPDPHNPGNLPDVEGMNKFIFPIAQLAGAAAFMPFEVLFLVTIVAAFVANIPLLKVRAARNSLRIRPG